MMRPACSSVETKERQLQLWMHWQAAAPTILGDAVRDHQACAHPSVRGQHHRPVEAGDLTGPEARFETQVRNRSIVDSIAPSASARLKTTHVSGRQHLCWRSHHYPLIFEQARALRAQLRF